MVFTRLIADTLAEEHIKTSGTSGSYQKCHWHFLPIAALLAPFLELFCSRPLPAHTKKEPEFSTKTFRFAQKCKDDVDKQKGLTKKRLYSLTHSPYTKPPFGTFLISYVGRDEWYGLENYVERIHCITDGHLMVEVNALRDKFFLTFMEVGNNRKFYDAFLEAMREENIHY